MNWKFWKRYIEERKQKRIARFLLHIWDAFNEIEEDEEIKDTRYFSFDPLSGTIYIHFNEVAKQILEMV